MTTFTLDDLPGVVFTVERGTGGNPELPSNWMKLVGMNEAGETVCDIGFLGP